MIVLLSEARLDFEPDLEEIVEGRTNRRSVRFVSFSAADAIRERRSCLRDLVRELCVPGQSHVATSTRVYARERRTYAAASKRILKGQQLEKMTTRTARVAAAQIAGCAAYW